MGLGSNPWKAPGPVRQTTRHTRHSPSLGNTSDDRLLRATTTPRARATRSRAAAGAPGAAAVAVSCPSSAATQSSVSGDRSTEAQSAPAEGAPPMAVVVEPPLAADATTLAVVIGCGGRGKNAEEGERRKSQASTAVMRERQAEQVAPSWAAAAARPSPTA